MTKLWMMTVSRPEKRYLFMAVRNLSGTPWCLRELRSLRHPQYRILGWPGAVIDVCGNIKYKGLEPHVYRYMYMHILWPHTKMPHSASKYGGLRPPEMILGRPGAVIL